MENNLFNRQFLDPGIQIIQDALREDLKPLALDDDDDAEYQCKYVLKA